MYLIQIQKPFDHSCWVSDSSPFTRLAVIEQCNKPSSIYSWFFKAPLCITLTISDPKIVSAQCCALLLWWGRVRLGHDIWYDMGFCFEISDLQLISNKIKHNYLMKIAIILQKRWNMYIANYWIKTSKKVARICFELSCEIAAVCTKSRELSAADFVLILALAIKTVSNKSSVLNWNVNCWKSRKMSPRIGIKFNA